jgi:hypothetical protein
MVNGDAASDDECDENIDIGEVNDEEDDKASDEVEEAAIPQS